MERNLQKPYERKARNRKKRPGKNEVLKLYKSGMLQREIAQHFGWTQPGISELMTRYGIASRNSNKWDAREEEILKKAYLNISKEELLSVLPHRTWSAIKLKAMKLKLARKKKDYNTSKEIKDRLRCLAKKNLIKIDFEKSKELAYILGVLDGDGYTNKTYTLGLETKTKEFAEKFKDKLRKVGFNSNMKFAKKDNKSHWFVWGSSKKFIQWYLSLSSQKKKRWLLKKQVAWEYLKGLYDSDGALHPCGCPQICSHNAEQKKFVSGLLDALNISNNIHKDKIWIRAKHADIFFKKVESIIPHRNPGNKVK